MKFTYKEDIIILEQLLKTKENATSNSSYFTVYRGLQGYGQDRKGYYQAEIGGGVTADRLPFWLHTNTFGKITNDTYLWGLSE